MLTTRGGGYGPGTPREGWDHNTAYLRRIIADVWGAELILIERELTLVGVNPALDPFLEIAERMRKAAHEAASHAGRTTASSWTNGHGGVPRRLPGSDPVIVQIR